MSLTLKPYVEYKESGLPWLGRIPAHWRLLRAKHVFSPIDIRSEDGNEELLTVSSRDGVLPRSQKKVTMFKAESYVGHKLCWPGDLVINSLWAWANGLGFTRLHGIISSAYGVYRPKPRFRLLTWYLNYLLRSSAYDWEFHVRSKGIWVSRLQLTDESFFDMPILLPEPQDARAIITFLDGQDRHIRKLIRAKRRVIELLNEQKQAIIHRAVTRGLDPNIRLKPSGIEWLGDVPEHWKTDRAKYSIREVDERSATGQEELLSVSHITGVSPRSQKNITMFMALSYVGHKICRPGDLVINTMWAWMGALGVSDLTGIVSPSYAVYRLKNPEAFNPQYLDCLLRSRPYISEFICRSTGIRSSRLRLYPEQLFRIPLLQPPRAEQDKIVEAFSMETARLEISMNSVKREIELLREYRTRLIADVVTGKLDVRGIALPEEKDDETIDLLGEPDGEDLAEADDAQEEESVEA